MKKARIAFVLIIVAIMGFYIKHRLGRLHSNEQLIDSMVARSKTGILEAIKAGADVHTKDPNGNSAILRIAILESSWESDQHPPRPAGSVPEWPEIANRVLDADKAPEKFPDDLQHEFIMAIVVGRKDVVEKLIGLGANLNASGKEAYNPGFNSLSTAVSHGQTEIAELLLAKGAKPEQASDLLYDALVKCSPELFQHLLHSGISVNATGFFGSTALSQLARDGTLGPRKMACLNLLLAAGANINLRPIVPMEHREGTKFWLTQAPTPYTPLLEACYAGDQEFVQALLSHGAKIESDTSYLYAAAISGNKKLVQFLLDKGVSPLAKYGSGETASTAYRKEKNKKPDILAILSAADRKIKPTNK